MLIISTLFYFTPSVAPVRESPHDTQCALFPEVAERALSWMSEWRQSGPAQSARRPAGRNREAIARCRGFVASLDSVALATASTSPKPYSRGAETRQFAFTEPKPTARQARTTHTATQRSTTNRRGFIEGAGSVRISPTLPTTSSSAHIRSRKHGSSHKHGDFPAYLRREAFLGRTRGHRPGQPLKAGSIPPHKDFLKDCTRDPLRISFPKVASLGDSFRATARARVGRGGVLAHRPLHSSPPGVARRSL